MLGSAACKSDSEFLNVQPSSVLTIEQAFKDLNQALSVLADLHNGQWDISGLDNGWGSFADFSETFPSENGSKFFVQCDSWNFGEWNMWDYGYIRNVNLFY